MPSSCTTTAPGTLESASTWANSLLPSTGDSITINTACTCTNPSYTVTDFTVTANGSVTPSTGLTINGGTIQLVGGASGALICTSLTTTKVLSLTGTTLTISGAFGGIVGPASSSRDLDLSGINQINITGTCSNGGIKWAALSKRFRCVNLNVSGANVIGVDLGATRMWVTSTGIVQNSNGAIAIKVGNVPTGASDDAPGWSTSYNFYDFNILIQSGSASLIWCLATDSPGRMRSTLIRGAISATPSGVVNTLGIIDQEWTMGTYGIDTSYNIIIELSPNITGMNFGVGTAICVLNGVGALRNVEILWRGIDTGTDGVSMSVFPLVFSSQLLLLMSSGQVT